MANMKADDWADLYRAHLKVGAQTTPTIGNKSAEFTRAIGFRPGRPRRNSTTGPSCLAFRVRSTMSTEELKKNVRTKASDIRSFVPKPNGLSSMVELNVGGIVKRTRIYGPGWRSAVWLQGCTLACKGLLEHRTLADQRRDAPHREDMLAELLTATDCEG